ncbi:MAG: secretin N-terminal domain-containing protein [Armatimonadota bacterium]|nr:secretin N-terminal domain-containing protein [Armatimonadota bacterium]MDR7605593.1 secretin N-terminal domain-containing protein [Armatimonadota bacterium]MDR7610535.1 secretin N-terminal domain-containing protein [Armatimonadota bacterium]
MNTRTGRRRTGALLALVLAGWLLAPAQPASAALATVTDVLVKQFPGKLQVTVLTDAAVRYRVADWPGKPEAWVVVDVLGAQLALPPGELPYRGGDLMRVRVGQFNATTVRVVVELAGPRSYTVEPIGGAYGLVIAILSGTPSRPAASANPVVPPGAVAQAQQPSRPRQYTLEFRDARFSDVMAALARLANLNIVVAPEAAEKRVTVRLVNVSLEDALNLLTQPLGLGWVRVAGNIVVVPSDKLPGEPLEIRYYRLQYASAEDVAKQVEPLLFGRRLVAPQPVATPAPGQPPAAAPAVAPVTVVERSQVAVDKRTNTLIVIASRTDHERVAQIVQRLDVPIPVSPVVTRIYPLRWLNADLKAPEGGPAREIGAEIVALLKAHLSPSAIVTFDYQNNAVVLTALEGDHERAQQLLAQVDVPTQQVLIEASALDLSVDVARDLGLQWQVSVLNIPGTPSQGQVFYNPSTGAVDFFVQINALISQGKGRLLANPRIVTKDGQAGEVFIGDQIPVVTGVTPQGVPQVVFIDAGVKLNITPKINPDGMITVRILTEVGVARQFATGVGKSTRKAVTTLTVRDGSPIVIGGLIRTEERTTTIKIPLLGDIPIIGFLFRREQTTQSTSEVVFVVTPRSLPRATEPRG